MTLLQAVRSALEEAMADRTVLLLGQLVKYGLGGLTTGLHESHPGQLITWPVAENSMHAAAMGMALAGMRPVVVNERMDFLALAMDPLVNHAAVWPKRDPGLSLPMVVVAVVGKGKGQGPQHSKNLTPWFRSLEGFRVFEPDSPWSARTDLLHAVRGSRPALYVLHREFFGSEGRFFPPRTEVVGLCGASARHERAFYEAGDDPS